MRRLLQSRKAYTIADIPWVAIVFGVGIIVLSIISQIVGEIKETQCTDEGFYWNSTEEICQSSASSSNAGGGYATNTSEKGQTGVSKIANWMPTIGLVIGAVIVIVALAVLFTMQFRA